MTWTLPQTEHHCEACHYTFLVAQPQICPWCFNATLKPVTDEEPDAAQIPELVIPFSISPEEAASYASIYTEDMPYKPPRINRQALEKRLRQGYILMWLIDGHVQAQWTCEVGEYKDVVNYHDRYNLLGKWISKENDAQRLYWEPRMGLLKRFYINAAVHAWPTTEKAALHMRNLDSTKGEPFSPERLQGTFIQLPVRGPEDAWEDAVQKLAHKAEKEVQQATAADATRDFRWKPDISEQHWTLMLVPIYTTYYEDSRGRPRTLYIDGMTGRTSGELSESLRDEFELFLTFLKILGVALFVIALVLFLVLVYT